MESEVESEMETRGHIDKMKESNNERSQKDAKPQLEKGDYILVLKPGKCRKLHSRLAGPFQVLKKVRDNVYRVQHVRYGEVSIVHQDRIVPFDEAIIMNDAMLEQAGYLTDHGYRVNEVLALRFGKEKNRWEVKVKWQGLEEISWEDIVEIRDDVPKLVDKFLKKNGKMEIVKRFKKEEEAV
jgi:hypothetical protein